MTKMYSIGEAAKKLNISIITIRRWEEKGQITIVRNPSGHRRIAESEIQRILGVTPQSHSVDSKKALIYCRVSTKKQSGDGNLDRQEERLIAYAYKNNYEIVKIFKETASGVNERRPELLKALDMIKNGQANYFLVEYKDRLTRFGYNYLQKYIEDFGAKVVVLDSKEVDKNKELVDDLIAIVSSFSAKIYGSRGGRKLKEAIEELQKEEGENTENHD